MMLPNFFRRFAVVMLLAAAATAEYGGKIVTKANGAQEGHIPTHTQTTATLITEFDEGFSNAFYTLEVYDGVKVTEAHFHCAAAGEDGPIVAYLYGPYTNGRNVNGRIASKFLHNMDISNTTDFKNTPGCGVTITTIASLNAAMQKGLIYLNVHTVANPKGEIRGQVFV